MTEDWLGDGTSDTGTSRDDFSTERLVSRTPVVVRRRVAWGECDPAQVVYTPRFADYLVAAYFWFVRVVLADALTLGDGSRLATPMKALALEFQHVLRPDEIFDMTVEVAAVRRRTFDLIITARSMAGEPRFSGRLSPIVVDSAFRSVALPEPAIAALAAYRSSFDR